MQVDSNTAARTHNVYSKLQYSPWSVDRGLSVASVGRGYGEFVDPAPEELLDSCKLAGRGKASTTTFTICGISSVVKGSFHLRFSAGKVPEEVSGPTWMSHSSRDMQPRKAVSPVVCILAIHLLLRVLMSQAEFKFTLLKLLSDNVAALRMRC